MKKFYFNYLNFGHKFSLDIMIGILMYMVVFSGLFGWVYEFIFYFFNGGMKEFYMRGGNFLPWINIYAIGAVMIFLLCYRYRKNPLKVFLISVISTGILEYFSGYFMYKLAGLRCWDYRSEILTFGNIYGFVCTRSVLVFGIFSLVLMYLVVPILFYMAKTINKKKFLVIGYILFSIVITDELYNLVFARVLGMPRASYLYKRLGLIYLFLLKYVKFKL